MTDFRIRSHNEMVERNHEQPRATESFLTRLEIKKAKKEIYPEWQKEEPEVKNFGTNSTLVAGSLFFQSMFSPTILVMPGAFKNGGLLFSVFGFITLVILISYNISRLVVSAEYLSKREKLVVRTYDQVAFVSFETCNEKTKSYARFIRFMVNITVIVTNIDALSIFIIFIAKNIHSIVMFYFPLSEFQVRHFIYFQVIIIMMLILIRQLKYLSPFSITASFIMWIAVVLCFSSYLVRNTPSVWERKQITGVSILRFVAVVLFSQSGISIALTLKSGMKKPQQFLSIPGVYCVAITLACLGYIPFGYVGYLRFGEETKPSIMLNLPNDEYESIAIKMLTIISIFMYMPVVFYVAFNVLWNNFIKSKVSHSNELALEYLVRNSLILVPFLLAMIFPTLGPMIVLKGALFHSQLEVVFPPILEFVTFYPQKGNGKAYCRLIKAMIISFIGLFFCVSGTVIGIWDLLNMSNELIH